MKNLWKKAAAAAMALVMTFSLAGCGSSGHKLSDEAKAAQDAIDVLPDTYSADAVESLSSAQKLYDALSADDKEDVDAEKLDTLNASKKELVDDPAAEVNDAIKNLDLKYGSNSEIKAGMSALKDVTNKIKDTSTLADPQIDYEAFSKKTLAFVAGITDNAKSYTADLGYITKALESYTSALSSFKASSVSAYSKMLDCVGYLEKIKNFNARNAIDSANDLAADFRSYSLSTSNINVVNSIISDSDNFYKEAKQLGDKILSESKSYNSSAEDLSAIDGVTDLLEERWSDYK